MGKVKRDMGLSDLFNKQKYVIRTIFNGQLVSRKSERVQGQSAFYLKKSKLAYMIPDRSPINEGNSHLIDYEISDACPLADLRDIAPDMIWELEHQIVSAYSKAVDLTLNDPEKLLENCPLSDIERIQLEKAKGWLDRYKAGPMLGRFYNLWRWGYLKGEAWYKALVYVPSPEMLVFPKKYVRVGVHPKVFYALEKSTMATDIIRRQEPPWEWLKELIIPVLVFAVICFIIYKLA
jgi:hypothetical protein